MADHLCQLAGDWRGMVPPDGWLVEPKIDGWRCLWFEGVDGKTRLWTRQGHFIEGAPHIAWRLSLLERAAGEPLFLDGEFQVDGSLEATKAWCERGWKLGGEAGLFYLFDGMTLAEWKAGGSERPLWQRKAWLADLMRAVDEDESLSWDWRPGSRGRDEGATPVILMPETWAFDLRDVVDEANRIWAAGGEGLMLKGAEAPYQRNRNGAWQKVKRENYEKWRKVA